MAYKGHITIMPTSVSLPPAYSNMEKRFYDLLDEKEEGTSYGSLQSRILKEFPLLKMAIHTRTFENILDNLVQKGKVVRNHVFWKYAPYSDQLFTHENYAIKEKRIKEYKIKAGRTKFFGRSMTPDLFIEELRALDLGDLDDQDDQVTRIAGLVLGDAARLKSPEKEMKETDFVVDITTYDFRPEQEALMQKLDFKITSNLVCCKVMINDTVQNSTLSRLRDDVANLLEKSQGTVFTCRPVDPEILQQTKEDRTVQVVDEEAIRSWCNINPTVPCRLHSVARVMYGDDLGKIVLVKSLNYESGLATVEMIPDSVESTIPIGSIAETLPDISSLDDFEAVSGKYLEFLNLLAEAAQDSFETGMGLKALSTHSDQEDLLKSASPELFDSSGRYLGPEHNNGPSGHVGVPKTWYVQFEDAHVTITMSGFLPHSGCTCGHLLDADDYHTLCPHLVAGLDLICRGSQANGQTVADNASHFITVLKRFRLDNIKRSMNTLNCALSPKHNDILESYLQECSKRV